MSEKKKSKIFFISSICGIVLLLVVVFAGQFHYIDPQYTAFKQYLGTNDNCSFIRSVIQQDTYLQGTKDLQLLKQDYSDQKCGNPDLIPKEHSVIINAINIQTITNDDIDFEHIPKDHTIVIDCVIWNIASTENSTKFDELMKQYGCIMSFSNYKHGSWRYFN